MRYVSYEHDGSQRLGILEGQQIVPLDGFHQLGQNTSAEALRHARRLDAEAVELAEVRLRPVVPNPDKVICVGLNYRSHVSETGRELPTYPVLFTKFASALIGADDPIALPPESTQVDWEGEMAVVIGAVARRVSRDQALDVVLGYTVANDVTMRDFQYKTHQWLQGKAWQGSTPLGPSLVTPDEINGSGLAIRSCLNGEEVQSSSTSLLIFDVATLISTISTFTTLLPGDVILTGTPEGVGYRRDPQLFLADGDLISVTIEGLGTVANRVTDEPGVVRQTWLGGV
jgi:acylpyruvate hydrolase